jgi:copper oxidase (laccase) domain-containing protein
MRSMGATDISAIIGPSICGSCYEVSQEIYDEIVALHPAAASKTVSLTPALNLPAALREVLKEKGVAIVDEFRCTVEDSELFSYRRDGITGRQVGIISL